MQPFSTVLLAEGSIIDLDATFFVQLVVFGVAFFVLRALVFKPLIAVFEAREAAIDGAKAEARKLSEEAVEAGATFEEELRKVRIAAGAKRDELRADGRRLEQSILEAVAAETQQQMREAAEQLDREAEKLRGHIHKSVPELGAQIASKLLHREVS